MKVFRIVLMVAICGALLTSCKKKAPAAPTNADTTTSAPSATAGIDFDALSNEMCTCAKDVMDLALKSKSLQASGDMKAIAELIPQITAKSEEMEKCMATLETKYPGIDGNAEYEEKAQAALKRNCPKFAEAMEN